MLLVCAKGLSRCQLAAPRPPSVDGALTTCLPWCMGLECWYLPHGVQSSACGAAPVAEHLGQPRRLAVDALRRGATVVAEAAGNRAGGHGGGARPGGGAGPGGDQKRAGGESSYCLLLLDLPLPSELIGSLGWLSCQRVYLLYSLACEESTYKFIRVIYYQFKHVFQHTYYYRGSEDKGNYLFLDEAWFSRDIFLYSLSMDFLSVILEAPVVDGDLLSWFALVVVEMDGSS